MKNHLGAAFGSVLGPGKAASQGRINVKIIDQTILPQTLTDVTPMRKLPRFPG
jgi:hypothetical protein